MPYLSVCSPVNCITCHDGLVICIITMSNVVQRESLLLADEDDAPVLLVCHITFEPSKMGDNVKKIPVIPKRLKELYQFEC